jgi:hypothetical protein
MSFETQKYSGEMEKDPHHSAFDEFGRDERRPAVMLLAGLVIAVLFFALGLVVGRWTLATETRQAPLISPDRPLPPVNAEAPIVTPTASTSPTSSPGPSIRPTPTASRR